MIDFHQWSEHLRDLADHPPTDAARAEVEVAFVSPSDSMATLAARIMAKWGKWGDRLSVEGVMEWVRSSFAWMRGNHYKADLFLSQCIAPQDFDWFLNFYFSLPDYCTPILPRPPIGLPLLICKNTSNTRVKAHKFSIAGQPYSLHFSVAEYPATQLLLARFKADPDHEIRQDAARFLSYAHKPYAA